MMMMIFNDKICCCYLQLADVGCLVYQTSTSTYQPFNKQWIKEKIYMRQAAGIKEEPPH